MKILNLICVMSDDDLVRRMQAVMTIKEAAARMSVDPQDLANMTLVDLPDDVAHARFTMIPVPFDGPDRERVLFLHALRYLGNNSPDDLHETNFSIYLEDGSLFNARLTKVKGQRMPPPKEES